MNKESFYQQAELLMRPILEATNLGLLEWDYNEWDPEEEWDKTPLKEIGADLPDERGIRIYSDGDVIIMSAPNEEGESSQIFRTDAPLKIAQTIFNNVTGKHEKENVAVLASFCAAVSELIKEKKR